MCTCLLRTMSPLARTDSCIAGLLCHHTTTADSQAPPSLGCVAVVVEVDLSISPIFDALTNFWLLRLLPRFCACGHAEPHTHPSLHAHHRCILCSVLLWPGPLGLSWHRSPPVKPPTHACHLFPIPWLDVALEVDAVEGHHKLLATARVCDKDWCTRSRSRRESIP